jgi:2-polyprenyl-3-methyl-5-hydroxy-6-metoxy-1,4-benzoquinol methylase
MAEIGTDMSASKDSVDPVSLERIIPDELRAGEATGQETLDLHVARYQFAKSNLIPGKLLDMACGVGYGTAILSHDPQITQAVGVDLSSAAIQYATGRYSGERVSFLCADALKFRSSEQFDNIVSLETIEHVDAPCALFAHLVSLLAPGGRLIASVPVTPSVDANPHHKTNFSKKRFLTMGDEHSLKCLNSFNQLQRFSPITIALGKEVRAGNLRKNLASFYLRHPSHLVRRMWSTLCDGFANKYLTVVWEKEAV